MKYVCDVCGWEYDEEEGYPEGGIAPGTKWEDVPEDFERRWLEETGRFKNVVWVQNGGKRLVIKHGKR